MDLNLLKSEQTELLKALKNIEPGTPEYTRIVNDFKKLEDVKISDENATFERGLKKEQHDSKVAEEKRRFDLDRQIRIGQLELEKEDKKRRYELEKTERNRRFESEKRVNDAEVSAKMAEIELNKRKFEFDMEDRNRRFEEEIAENQRRIDLELARFNHEKSMQIERLKLDSAMNLAAIAEKQAQMEKLGGENRTSILEKVLPACAGLIGAVLTINAEETRILTSKGLSVFKSIKS